jgi:hypothetical protein
VKSFTCWERKVFLRSKECQPGLAHRLGVSSAENILRSSRLWNAERADRLQRHYSLPEKVDPSQISKCSKCQ